MSAALALVRARVGPWPRHLAALGVASLAMLALFYRDALEMAAVWWNSPTFNHILLVPPLIAWLVHQRLPGLRRIDPAAWAPGLALVGFGGILWLLGEAGGVALARHAGLVVMLQGAVVACLGKAVMRALVFPIFYALFLIPAGDQLVPPLQTLTAEMAMGLLGLAGVPAHIDGVFITTPSGYFEVAEACAGVRFLIAMIAFGALAANLCFTSWRRRILFLAACIAVPILANGVRAWATIYIAYFAGIEFAAGFDHILYGWVFFAAVIAAILAVAWRWFDRAPDARWFDPAALRQGARTPLGLVAGATVALAALPLAWSMPPAAQAVPDGFELPAVPGWQRIAAVPDWRPRFAGADLFRRARYRDERGREVDLALAVYARQEEGRELTSYGQGKAPGWGWTANALAPPDGRAERIASHGMVREVVTFYRVGRILTGSEAEVRLEMMKVRLLGGPPRAVAVLVSAPVPATGASARPAIEDFILALGPVDHLADRASGTR